MRPSSKNKIQARAKKVADQATEVFTPPDSDWKPVGATRIINTTKKVADREAKKDAKWNKAKAARKRKAAKLNAQLQKAEEERLDKILDSVTTCKEMLRMLLILRKRIRMTQLREDLDVSDTTVSRWIREWSEASSLKPVKISKGTIVIIMETFKKYGFKLED